MKTNYLLPHRVKLLGWILFISGFIFGFIVYTMDYQPEFFDANMLSLYGSKENSMSSRFNISLSANNIADEIAMMAFLLGAFLVAFSKEKVEDEFIYKLRTDSLVWAVIVNSIILMLAIIFVYDFGFFDIMVFNMFTPLVFFILRFNFMKLKSRSHEE